jgi:NAD-dependent deacetylase
LWKQYRAEDLATPHAFARDPRLVWEWYGWRRGIVRGCEPNAAHVALAEAARVRPDFRIVTQNVDGLHVAVSKAETDRPLELHGSLFRVRCTQCSARWQDRADVDTRSIETLPKCETCSALARPDIVWFGESLDPRVLHEAMELASNADVCLVVGTSALVHPAAGLADLTRRAGGSVIEVNIADTPLTSRSTVALRGPTALIIPAVVPSGAP